MINIGGYDATSLATQFVHLSDLAVKTENVIYVPTPSGSLLLSAYQIASSRVTPRGIPRCEKNPVFIFLAPGVYNLGNSTTTLLTLSAEYVHLIGIGSTPIDFATITGNLHFTLNEATTKSLVVQTARNVLIENIIFTATVTNENTVAPQIVYPFTPRLLAEGSYALNKTTGIITKNDHGFRNGDRVSFTLDQAGTLTNFTPKKIYIVRNATVSSFRLAETLTGSLLVFGGPISNPTLTIHQTIFPTTLYRKVFFDLAIATNSTHFELSSLSNGVWPGIYQNCHFGAHLQKHCCGIFENCMGDYFSYASGYYGGIASGTFRNCHARAYGFGSGTYGGIASGIFENCYVTESFCFGSGLLSGGVASGTFFNCKGTEGCFGSGRHNAGIASGTFIDCYSSLHTGFGSSTYASDPNTVGVASGTFINCRGEHGWFFGSSPSNCHVTGRFINCHVNQGGNSFGRSNKGLISGIFIDCSGGDHVFGSYFNAHPTLKQISGVFINCTSRGNYSFGGGVYSGPRILGLFINCVGKDYSFGGSSNSVGGQLTGLFCNCVGENYSFGGGNHGGTVSGEFLNCVAKNYSFGGAVNNGGTVSGKFLNCVGTMNSFGRANTTSGILTGRLYYCFLSENTFLTPTGLGAIRLSVDSTNNIVNIP